MVSCPLPERINVGTAWASVFDTPGKLTIDAMEEKPAKPLADAAVHSASPASRQRMIPEPPINTTAPAKSQLGAACGNAGSSDQSIRGTFRR
eukprot:6554368-Prymnesium_polylepis.3